MPIRYSCNGCTTVDCTWPPLPARGWPFRARTASMINTTPNLRLQVWLYLLCISGLLTGLLGSVGQVWPGLAIPETLMVTMSGSVVLLLGSLVMLALMLQSRRLRYL